MDERTKLELFQEIDALYESLVLKPERELKKAEAAIRAGASPADLEDIERYIAKARADARQREQITRAYLRESARNQKLEEEKLQNILTPPIDLGRLADWVEDEERGATFLDTAHQPAGIESAANAPIAGSSHPHHGISFEAIVVPLWESVEPGKKKPDAVVNEITSKLDAAGISLKDNISKRNWEQFRDEWPHISWRMKAAGKSDKLEMLTWSQACDFVTIGLPAATSKRLRNAIKESFHTATSEWRKKHPIRVAKTSSASSARQAKSNLAMMPIVQKAK